MSAERHSNAIAIAVLAVTPAVALAQEPGVVFRATPPPVVEAPDAASVLEPAGGQYVYANQSPTARPKARFAIGNAPRTEYTFFSAEEQHELRSLRDSLSNAPAHPAAAPEAARASSKPARATPRARACAPSARTAQIDTLPWPKVVHDGPKVCVPKLEFADKADWRDHLWCFDKGDGRVR